MSAKEKARQKLRHPKRCLRVIDSALDKNASPEQEVDDEIDDTKLINILKTMANTGFELDRKSAKAREEEELEMSL